MVYIIYDLFVYKGIDLKKLYNYLDLFFGKGIHNILYEYCKNREKVGHIVFIDVDDLLSYLTSRNVIIDRKALIELLDMLVYIGIVGKCNSYYIILPNLEKYL